MASLSENTARTISAFDAIESTIKSHGVDMSEITAVEEYPSKIDEVYQNGEGTGYSNGYEAGKKAECDEFWDNYMRSNYAMNYMFAGRGWTKDTLKLKNATLYPWSADSMFQLFNSLNESDVFDLVEFFKENNITLDLSRCVSMQNLFSGAKVNHIGVIDMTAVTSTYYGILASAYIITIDEIKVKESTKYSSTFNNAVALENLTITGIIGQNGFDVRYSTKLTKESITSIINALSTTTSGLTVTLSKTAVNREFETSKGAADGSSSTEWGTLIANKPNWKISLVE